MIILCLNCGSSSVKFRFYDWIKKQTLATGIVERIDLPDSKLIFEVIGKDKKEVKKPCPNHYEAIKLIKDILVDPQSGVIKDLSKVTAVGHRVVHGGERFSRSVIITDEVLNTFRELIELAPLHNPANILGIEAARELIPDVTHIAVMDTAWHQTIPKHVYMYALPYEWYEKYGIRRYGFHGTSLLYVSRRAAVLLGKDPFECKLVICHIGNGVSLNAVKYGISYDTSMGFTPLEGLIMGTRPGDHDVAADFYVMGKEKYSLEEMYSILNKKSGILGITGQCFDRRDVEKMAEKGDERAKLAIDMESYRIKKYIGAYAAAVGGIDAVIFTAGAGEKSSIIRAKVLNGLEFMGIKYDKIKNNLALTKNAESDISAEDSKVKVFVIPTDEERVFVEDVVALYEESINAKIRYVYRFQLPGYRNSIRDEAFEKECKKNPELKNIIAKIPDVN
jgi:acetate kinase